MKKNRGVSAINENKFNWLFNNTTNELKNQISNLITTGRVTSIVLDDTHPRFKEFGEWNGLGTIEFTTSNTVSNSSSPVRLNAKPLDPSSKFFPLINEIVYILQLPNSNLDDSSKTSNYYINIVGLWNHPHHNGYPYNPNELAPSQQKDYLQTELGNVRRVTDQSTEIFLGNTFVERADIHPLLPFEGDKILEGRWGNSIRFGSTVKNTNNQWSSTGENGDPITIFRNGQGIQSDEGWIPITEDINNENSSLYLTSTQKIPIAISSENEYLSYQSDPTECTYEFTGSQAILNSGRILFNTTTDHLMLSSIKSINLNAKESINFDTTGNTILQSNQVFLGSKNATEPVLLGDETVALLRNLLLELADLTNALSLQVGVPEGVALAPTNTIAATANTTINNLINNLDSLKSQYVKTA